MKILVKKCKDAICVETHISHFIFAPLHLGARNLILSIAVSLMARSVGGEGVRIGQNWAPRTKPHSRGNT